MIRSAFAFVVVVHGLVHLMGFAKALGYAELPQLTQPISRGAGLAWLVAAALLVGTAVALFAWPRGWWALALVAVVLSQALVAGAWRDARFGTVANVVVLAGAVFGFLAWGPWSFRATMARDVAAGLSRRAPQPVVTEADLAPLPPPVQRYLRVTGTVGQERIQAVRVRFAGALRGGPTEPWMPMQAVQVSFFDDAPARLFHVTASRGGVPFEALHRYVGPSAVFSVKVASAATVAHAAGPEMDRSETVTFLNDMALLAPATLLSPAIRWEAVDDRTARATFTMNAQTVRAELRFDAAGWLTGFWSDDRMMASKDAKTFRAARWSTPVQGRRRFGARELGAGGVAEWLLPEGTFEYARMTLEEVEFNPSR